jgi:hypothetical protein
MNGFNKKYLDRLFLDEFEKGMDYPLVEFSEESVYTGKVVSDEFCDFIMSKINVYENVKYKTDIHHANSMHKYTIPLEKLVLKDFIEAFVKIYLLKIIQKKFPDRFDHGFDEIHGYIVRYSKYEDVNLERHVDDSFVTANICLNENFLGSELVFNGVRCPIHLDSSFQINEELSITHQKAILILHDGKNRHYVNSIREGKRYSLIIWVQSNNERKKWLSSIENELCIDFCKYKK